MKEVLAEALGIPVPARWPGADCTCGAYASFECGCGADWTDPQIYVLEGKVAALLKILLTKDLTIPEEHLIEVIRADGEI